MIFVRSKKFKVSITNPKTRIFNSLKLFDKLKTYGCLCPPRNKSGTMKITAKQIEAIAPNNGSKAIDITLENNE